MDFLKGAKDLVRNPLGIIALFISLIYGFVSLLLNSSAEKLTEEERWPIIIFIVIFPVLVLWTFYQLVTNHHGKLYAPGDFKDDKSFLRTLSPEEQEQKIEAEVSESLGECSQPSQQIETQNETLKTSKDLDTPSSNTKKQEYIKLKDELRLIENNTIDLITSEFNAKASRNIGIGDTEAHFDAFIQTPGAPFTFIEVKVLRSSIAATHMLDRILYNAIIADKFFESKFKLIIAIVYYFEESDLARVEKIWRNRVNKCPVDVELRFMPISQIINT